MSGAPEPTQGPWPAPPPAWSPPPSRPTNGLAIAALVLGIVWIYWIGSLLATIFGFVALRQIRQSGDWQQGRGMAIAGLVLGLVGLGILALVIVVGLAGGFDTTSTDY